MAVEVWTERRTGAWDQCSECSYLMGLLHGGFTKFRLGAYTAAERDSFTMAEIGREESRAANKPMFPLMDDASQRRYGLRLRAVKGSAPGGRATWSELRARLSIPGNCVVLPGWYRALPQGHTLRRWQPNYLGGHMVAAIVRADRKILWLDPLAPNKYAGDVTDISTAMAFAWNPSDAHEVMGNELIGTPDTAVPKPPPKEEEVIHGIWPEWATPTLNKDTGESNGVLRAEPRRSAPVVARVPFGEKVLSIEEVHTEEFERAYDNGDWRVTVGPDGKPLYMLRADWQLLGRDAELNERFQYFIKTGTTADEQRWREWLSQAPA